MDKSYYSPDVFSLSSGGILNPALKRMRLHNNQGNLALMSLCITWLPLVIITAIEGTLYSGTQLPFLNDIPMQARLLVAIPMLILIKSAIEGKVSTVTKYLSDALMISEQQQQILNTALHRAKKLTSSVWIEILLLLIVVAATKSLVRSGSYSGLERGTTSWMTSAAEGSQAMSVAGCWTVIISIPIFQFLFLRWLYRYFVWMYLLFCLSRAKLDLLPTHADRSGGLGIILLGQRSFSLLFVVGSIVLSGEFIAQLMKYPDSFQTIEREAMVYIVICIVLLFIPLQFFTRKLVKTKNEGLLHLSCLGAALSRKFEREWINDLSIEKRIDEKQVDPSMIFDYSGMYDSLRQLRTVLVTPWEILSIAIALFIPFIPIPFIHFSVGEMFQKIVELLT